MFMPNHFLSLPLRKNISLTIDTTKAHQVTNNALSVVYISLLWYESLLFMPDHFLFSSSAQKYITHNLHNKSPSGHK